MFYDQNRNAIITNCILQSCNKLCTVRIRNGFVLSNFKSRNFMIDLNQINIPIRDVLYEATNFSVMRLGFRTGIRVENGG